MRNPQPALDQVNYRLTQMTNHLQEVAFRRQDHKLETAVDLIRCLQHELEYILDRDNNWKADNLVCCYSSIQHHDEFCIGQIKEALDKADETAWEFKEV